MVSFESSAHQQSSRSPIVINSTSTDQNSGDETGTKIIIFGTVTCVLIVVIFVSYRVCREVSTNKRRRNKQPSICSGRLRSVAPIQRNIVLDSNRVASVYVVPVSSRTLSDSRGVSSIYPVPVHRNTISLVPDDLPPAYDTVVQRSKGQSDAQTRF